MIRSFRYWTRLILILVWTLFVYGLYLCCWPFYGFQLQRLRGLRRRLFKVWGGLACWLLGMRLTVEGPVPKPPFMLVSNHISYVDIFLMARLTGTVFVAKSEMEHWPVIGPMMQGTHMMFINRVSGRDALRVIDDIKVELQHKDALTVFPEGICTSGATIEKFFPALFEAPASMGKEVHVAAIHYATPPGEAAAGDDVVWWRWEPVGEHLQRLLRLPYFETTIRFAENPIAPSSRKAMAQAAHHCALDLFTPVAQGVLPELPAPPEGIAPPPPPPSRRKRMVLRSRLQMRKMQRRMRRVKRRMDRKGRRSAKRR